MILKLLFNSQWCRGRRVFIFSSFDALALPLDLPDGYIVSPNHVLVVREEQSTLLDNTNEIQALFRSSKVEKPDGKEPASK